MTINELNQDIKKLWEFCAKNNHVLDEVSKEYVQDEFNRLNGAGGINDLNKNSLLILLNLCRIYGFNTVIIGGFGK